MRLVSFSAEEEKLLLSRRAHAPSMWWQPAPLPQSPTPSPKEPQLPQLPQLPRLPRLPQVPHGGLLTRNVATLAQLPRQAPQPPAPRPHPSPPKSPTTPLAALLQSHAGAAAAPDPACVTTDGVASSGPAGYPAGTPAYARRQLRAQQNRALHAQLVALRAKAEEENKGEFELVYPSPDHELQRLYSRLLDASHRSYIEQNQCGGEGSHTLVSGPHLLLCAILTVAVCVRACGAGWEARGGSRCQLSSRHLCPA